MNQLEQRNDDRSQALRHALIQAVEESAPARSAASRRQLFLAVGVTAAAAALAAAVAIPAFAPGGGGSGSGSSGSGGPVTSSGSRVKLYRSLAELVADSGAVVTGTIVRQTTGADGTTISEFLVARSFSPSGLGTRLTGPSAVADGATLHVRTFGGITSLPPATLEVGSEYLLFLTPTGLPGAAASDFFITGAGAGLYASAGGRYLRMVNDGDRLPGELTLESLTQQ